MGWTLFSPHDIMYTSNKGSVQMFNLPLKIFFPLTLAIGILAGSITGLGIMGYFLIGKEILVYVC